MPRAIVVAKSVDEVKDIRDKATALQKYAQLANNFDAERRAADIRIRAELQVGKLLKEREKAKGARMNGREPGGKHRQSSSPTAEKTLKQLGISKDQSSRWQTLAKAPDRVEEYLAKEEHVPTTEGALYAADPRKVQRECAKARAEAKPKHEFSDESLAFNGLVRDLVKLKADPGEIVKDCDPHLKAELRNNLDVLLPILNLVRSLL